MGATLLNRAAALYEAAHVFLAARLAPLGIESDFVATAILGVAGLALAWGLFLAVLNLLFAGLSRLSGAAPKPASAPARFAPRGESPRLEPGLGGARREPAPAPRGGALDVAPERLGAGAAARRGAPPGRPAGRIEPSLTPPPAPASSQAEADAPRFAAQALRDAPEGKLPFKKIALAEMPALAPLGRAGFARPEWTGAQAPASLQDAGAFEAYRFRTRTPESTDEDSPVRAIDYKVCSLPRVSPEGRKRPDLLVYTSIDRGVAPKPPVSPFRRK